MYTTLIVFFIIITGHFVAQKAIVDEKKRKFIYCLTMSLIFFFLNALRGHNVGNDTSDYVRLFQQISATGLSERLIHRYEIGYLYLNYGLAQISHEPQILLATCGAIYSFTVFWFVYKYSHKAWISFLVFFGLGHFTMGLSGIRHIVSLSFLMFSFLALAKEQKRGYFILNFLAVLFHWGALVGVLLLQFKRIKLSYLGIFVLLICAMLITFLLPFLFELFVKVFPRYSYYMNSVYADGNIKLAGILKLLTSCMFLVILLVLDGFSKNNIRINSLRNRVPFIENHRQRLLLFGFVLGVCFQIFALRMSIFGRISDFYLIILVLLLPNALANDSLSPKLCKLIEIGLVIFVVFYSSIITIFRPEWHGVFPYRFFFLEHSQN